MISHLSDSILVIPVVPGQRLPHSQEFGQVTKIPSISASLMTSGKAVNMSMRMPIMSIRLYISITLQYVQAFGKTWVLNFSTAT